MLIIALVVALKIVTLSLAPLISLHKHPKAIMLGCGLDLASPNLCSALCAYTSFWTATWPYTIHIGLPSTLLGVLHKSGFLIFDIVAALDQFIKENEATCIYHWTLNNLPPHVKGWSFYHISDDHHTDEWGYYITSTNPNTNETGSIAIEFIHNENTQEDNWFALYQPEGRKSWYIDLIWKIAIQNTYGLGWWNIDNPAHPDFVGWPGLSSQSAIQPERLAASPQAPWHKEFLAGAIHHIVTLAGPSTLSKETPDTPMTNIIYQAATSGSEIPMDIPPALTEPP